MRELQRTAAFIGVGFVADILATVITTKITSLLLGPTGVGLSTQTSSFLVLGATLAMLGLNLGVTRTVAAAREQHDLDAIGRVVGTVSAVAIIASFVSMLVSFAFAGPLSGIILGDSSQTLFIWLAAPGMIFLTMYYLGDSTGQGLRNAKILTQAKVGAAIIAPFLTGGLVLFMGLTGVVLGTMLRQVYTGALVVFMLLRALKQEGVTRRMLRFDRNTFLQLLPVAMSMLLVSAVVPFSQLLARSQIVGEMGLQGAGLFQAAWGLIFVVNSLTLTSLNYYTFPKVSALAEDKQRGEVINESVSFAILLLTASFLAILVPRELIISIFFRSDFQAAGGLMPLIALGVLFYVTWILVGTPLIPKRRLVALMLLNLFANLLFPALTAMFLPRGGLSGVGMAWIAANIITLGVYLLDQARSIGFRLSNENIGFIAISAITLSGEAFAAQADVLNLVIRIGLVVIWVPGMFWATGRYVDWQELVRLVQMRLNGLRSQPT